MTVYSDDAWDDLREQVRRAEVRARLHDDMRYRMSAELGNVLERTLHKVRACRVAAEEADANDAAVFRAKAEMAEELWREMGAAFEAGRALPDDRTVFLEFEAETGGLSTEVVAWAAGIVREALLRADGQVRYAIPLAAADVHPARWLGQTFKLLEGMGAMK